VEVISSVSPVAVTLFLDDIQWADAASISVLKQILMKGQARFFFLGCCRDDEMQNDHPFWKMTENVDVFGIKTTVVKLHGMEKDTLNEMVSDLLCLSPRLVRPLSEIVFNKTKGNPLFFSQLMLSLNRDGLLRISLSRQRWEWDEEEIQSRKLPDDVALCFANGICKLPLEVQAALHTLSCFGASMKCEFIQALESQLSLKLLEPLKIAAAEGLVINLKGSFNFCHDRIQAATYDLINETARLRDHLTYGLCLAKLALDSGNDEMLFTAVSQINLGGSSIVSDTQDSITKAMYNLSAGKRSILLSDFSSAYTFLTFGINFLPNNLWTDFYHLSLELFELAAKCALSIGNLSSLRSLSSEVMKNARCFDDKLNIYFTMISSLAYASKAAEAVEKSCAIVSRLGEDMPSNLTEESLVQHIQNTQSMIKGLCESDLLNYSRMTDATKLMSMKFLAKMQSLALMVNPNFRKIFSR
jgi:predicted ATPase